MLCYSLFVCAINTLFSKKKKKKKQKYQKSFVITKTKYKRKGINHTDGLTHYFQQKIDLIHTTATTEMTRSAAVFQLISDNFYEM